MAGSLFQQKAAEVREGLLLAFVYHRDLLLGYSPGEVKWRFFFEQKDAEVHEGWLLFFVYHVTFC